MNTKKHNREEDSNKNDETLKKANQQPAKMDRKKNLDSEEATTKESRSISKTSQHLDPASHEISPNHLRHTKSKGYNPNKNYNSAPNSNGK